MILELTICSGATNSATLVLKSVCTCHPFDEDAALDFIDFIASHAEELEVAFEVVPGPNGEVHGTNEVVCRYVNPICLHNELHARKVAAEMEEIFSVPMTQHQLTLSALPPAGSDVRGIMTHHE